MVPDFSRTLVSAFTRGNEGSSPYISSDVVGLLLRRGHTVQLKRVKGHDMTLLVDEHQIDVLEGGTDGGNYWFNACMGRGFVPFVGSRRIDNVPTIFYDKDNRTFDPFHKLYKGWMNDWPKKGQEWDDFSRTLGVHAASQPVRLCYLSEEAFCDAIESVITCTLACSASS